MQPCIPRAGMNLSFRKFLPRQVLPSVPTGFCRAGPLVQPQTLPALVSKQAEAEPARGKHPRYPPLSHPFPLCAAPLFSPRCQHEPWGICEFPFYKMNDKSISSHLHFCSQRGFNPHSPSSQSRGGDEPLPSDAPKPPP